jgi:methionine-rich copper-binding protein CopC
MSVTVRRARAALVTLAALAWLVVAPTVAADAELTATFPEAGGTVEATGTIAARFSQEIGAESSIELIGPDGDSVARGGVDPDDPRRLIIELDTALSPGEYEVRWIVHSADGHVVNDTFTFTVAEPAPTPTPEASAPAASPTERASPTPEPTEVPLPSAAPSPAPTSGSDVLIPIAAAVLVVGGLAAYILRNRR